MALERMPNGEYVNLPDNITAEGRARVTAQYQPTRVQNREAGRPRTGNQSAPGSPAPVTRRVLTPEEREIQQRADLSERGARGWTTNNALNRAVQRGVGSNFVDTLGSGLTAITLGGIDAIRHGDAGRIRRRYNIEQGVAAELDRRASNRSPVTSLVGEVGGSLASPIGTGGRLVSGAGRILSRVGATGLGTRAANLGTRLANMGPTATAIATGVNQGAVNAVGASDDWRDAPRAAITGGLVGGALGGIFGGGTNLARRGLDILRDKRPEAAVRQAHQYVGGLLRDRDVTPEQIRSGIEMAGARGNDRLVMDATPGLRGAAGTLARNSNVARSDEIIDRGLERISNRPGRFVERAREFARPPEGGVDEFARQVEQRAEQSARGAADYVPGGAMDTRINWTPEMDDFWRRSVDAEGMMPEAIRNARRFDHDIESAQVTTNAQGETVIQHVPTMRAFDFLKREFDDNIRGLLARDNGAARTKAEGMSRQLNRLKELIADANPEYADILRAQRDEFQKANALRIGDDYLKRLADDPRGLLRELRGLPSHAADDARVGMIDRLINLNNKGDPVKYFQTLNRTPEQREVWKVVFGGRRPFRQFREWVDTEAAAAKADVSTASARQSGSLQAALAGGEDITGASNTGDVIANAFRGFGFGGPTGALSAAASKFRQIKASVPIHTQEEIARILLSRGEGLAEGISAAAAYKATREQANKRVAQRVARGAQQPFTTALGR